MHFKAGYIADCIAEVITEFKSTLDENKPAERIQIDQITGLLQNASSFDVEFPEGHKTDHSKLNPVLATINNIITRGLPTRAPLILEKLFAEIGLTHSNNDEFEFNFPDAINPISYESVFELLHIIEPQLEINRSNYGGNLGSRLEWGFIAKHPFLKQILQSQRDFSTINARLQGNRTVDFCFTSPYLHWNEKNNRYEKVGRIFEVDGPHHSMSEYKYYDNYRDAIAEDVDFKTIRFSVEDITEVQPDFENLIGVKLYRHFKNNFNKKIKEYIAEYSLIFIPFAVARVQKTILEYLLAHLELFDKENIHIAIIERDLPCGAIAIKSLTELFDNINTILEGNDKLLLPKIQLTVFENKKWVIDSKLHLEVNVQDERFFDQNTFDIVVDNAILRRSNIYKETDFIKANSIKIRSSHYFDTSFGAARRVYCGDLLRYKSLVYKKDDGSYDPNSKYEASINYFIQNIFRKVSFRAGQLPIISRALQLKPVIGLLPTGGGKSLTFQLPAFLQPGLCLVVDPIKSLMEDQVRVLRLNWIDSCGFLNSNLKREEKNKKLVDFRYGEIMFLFVSPERFVMHDFRNIISKIGNSKLELAFSYCVIDEVHCVSEWGHDFRTTYLMLGKNAQKFAKTKNGNDISIIGLTATASFDVLTDIERELRINSEDINDAVISIDNTIRPELFFTVVENTTKVTSFPAVSQSLKDIIGFAKQAQINKQIQVIIEKLNSINEEVVTECLKQHFNDFELNINLNDVRHIEYTNQIKKNILKKIEFNSFEDVVSVIFCPHTKGTFGITQEANQYPKNKEIFENLVIPNMKKGYYMGGDDKIKKEVLENAQKFFLQFMQGKINYMVCTKAFGMGIDKEHIRSVYHLNFSSSPESYIQEAGRAGRDKVKSICSIFLDRNFYYTISHDFIIDNYRVNFQVISDRKKARELFEDYNSFQNRISEKYYGDPISLSNVFKNIGVELDEKYIVPFNQDLAIHDYFHRISFKGIETELFQLNRFINYEEGLNTTQLKLLQEKYNREFDEEIYFNLTLNGKYSGNLWINNSKGNSIGKIFTANNNPTCTVKGLPAKQESNIIKTQQVLDYLVDEWNNSMRKEQLLFDFLKREIIEGLNNGLSLIEYFKSSETENFWFKVPTTFINNNLETRLIYDFNLAELPVFNQNNKTVEFLKTLKDYSANFEDFILRIEEQWDISITSNAKYTQNSNEYKPMFYSEINSGDVSRIIYRLYSIGLVDDYTIDYNLGIFSFQVYKGDKIFYLKKTETHLLKYLSRTATLKKIQDLTNSTLEMSVFDTIKQCVKEIVLFTYGDIVKKRKAAVNDLFKFITESLDISKQKFSNLPFNDYWYNYHFKDEMYYYFNAKYARVGFKIGNEPYSLLDDTEKGQISNWETFEKYAKVLNGQSSFISECKMMRGSCRRIWRTLSKVDNDREFILKILSSFATFGLNNKYYYQDAEDLFITGFSIYHEENKNFILLKSRIDNFGMHLFNCTSNKQYLPYFNLAKHKILLKYNLDLARKINQQLINTK